MGNLLSYYYETEPDKELITMGNEEKAREDVYKALRDELTPLTITLEEYLNQMD